jgi:hypothetical protein
VEQETSSIYWTINKAKMKKIKYILNEFRWIKALFSPFKPFTVRWYVGKTAIGVPYFFPRKWVKSKTKPGYMEPVPIKVGFDYCGLGWKTKWTQYDIRYEWGPVFTFVFFGYQIAAMVGTKDKDCVSHYWEAWVCYEYCSDKKQSKCERIAFCRKKCPQTWTRLHKDGTKITTDYWDLILKPKYLKP